jgi:hypothetical protein
MEYTREGGNGERSGKARSAAEKGRMWKASRKDRTCRTQAFTKREPRLIDTRSGMIQRQSIAVPIDISTLVAATPQEGASGEREEGSE